MGDSWERPVRLELAQVYDEDGDVVDAASLVGGHGDALGSHVGLVQPLSNIESRFLVAESVPKAVGCQDQERGLVEAQIRQVEGKDVGLSYEQLAILQ